MVRRGATLLEEVGSAVRRYRLPISLPGFGYKKVPCWFCSGNKENKLVVVLRRGNLGIVRLETRMSSLSAEPASWSHPIDHTVMILSLVTGCCLRRRRSVSCSRQ
jgi:hypothetical protein